jgi:hypothetical protein
MKFHRHFGGEKVLSVDNHSFLQGFGLALQLPLQDTLIQNRLAKPRADQQLIQWLSDFGGGHNGDARFSRLFAGVAVSRNACRGRTAANRHGQTSSD